MRRTTMLSALLVFLLACMAGCTDEHNPSLPGDGDGDGTGDGDGDGDGDADAATQAKRVTGTLCLVTDLRDPEACPEADLAGAIIAEQGTGNQATAAADGTFTVFVDATTQVTLEISGTGLRPSLFPVVLGENGASGVTVPAVDQTDWTTVVEAVIGVEPDETGAIAVYLTEDGGPALGAEVYPPATSEILPFYENGGPLAWTQTALTGASGAALLFGLLTDTPTVSFDVDNSSGSAFQTVSDVPVATATTTFITVDVSGE